MTVQVTDGDYSTSIYISNNKCFYSNISLGDYLVRGYFSCANNDLETWKKINNSINICKLGFSISITL